jgi:hypothetical protein
MVREDYWGLILNIGRLMREGGERPAKDDGLPGISG